MKLSHEEQERLETEARSLSLESLRDRYIELALEAHEFIERGFEADGESTSYRREVYYAELKARNALTALAPLMSSGSPVLEYRAAGILAKLEPTGAFREAAFAKLDELASKPYGYISAEAEALMNGIRFGTPFA